MFERFKTILVTEQKWIDEILKILDKDCPICVQSNKMPTTPFVAKQCARYGNRHIRTDRIYIACSPKVQRRCKTFCMKTTKYAKTLGKLRDEVVIEVFKYDNRETWK